MLCVHFKGEVDTKALRKTAFSNSNFYFSEITVPTRIFKRIFGYELGDAGP